jgi:tetratricopeptide (TPR) repeat protein
MRTSKHSIPVIGLLLLASSAFGQEKLVVVCTSDTDCDYLRAAQFLVQGRPAVRVIPATDTTGRKPDLKHAPEVKIDQISGLYRDPSSGEIHSLSPEFRPDALAIPSKPANKDAANVVAAWEGTSIEYRQAAKGKSGVPVQLESFVALIVSRDLEHASVEFTRYLLQTPAGTPRRNALVRRALQFAGNSQSLLDWQKSLINEMQAGLTRFEKQDGDPTELSAALESAVRSRATFLQIRKGDDQAALLDRVAAAERKLHERIIVAQALRQAAYWDEYLAKLDQIGLLRWSVPNVLQLQREALEQSARLHSTRAQEFADGGKWDRAFDEAQLAVANQPCNTSALEQFYTLRVEFVNRNRIPLAAEYSGRNRAQLEQIVRELSQMDTAKERRILERIRQGENLDPNYLPLQWKKAEFLDTLGRYGEALKVIRRVERNTPMDSKQMEECLRLDGRVSNNLADAVQKAQEQAKARFEEPHYIEALDTSTKGLIADPNNAALLYYRALSAAFLRENTVAMESINTYLKSGNLLCAGPGEPERMLDLYRLLISRRSMQPSGGGSTSWISGKRFPANGPFYDPISLAFMQPVVRISSDHGPSTVVHWEGRSSFVRLISTGRLASNNNDTKKDVLAGTTIFEAEPKYDRKSLTMLEIGAPATSTGERSAYALTYLNSPGVDPDLVQKFTGKQIARGFAGNPFFHPFIWNGFYIFELTYDRLGRVEKATPVKEQSGSRLDPFSDTLFFTWDGDSDRLMSVRGAHSGYVRELTYDKEGRLRSEKITHPKGHGSIEYTYVGNGVALKSAKCNDSFYVKYESYAFFDPVMQVAP